jgi:hypothetical protein
MEDYHDEFEGYAEDYYSEDNHDQEIIDSAFDGDAEAYYIWKIDH